MCSFSLTNSWNYIGEGQSMWRQFYLLLYYLLMIGELPITPNYSSTIYSSSSHSSSLSSSTTGTVLSLSSLPMFSPCNIVLSLSISKIHILKVFCWRPTRERWWRSWVVKGCVVHVWFGRIEDNGVESMEMVWRGCRLCGGKDGDGVRWNDEIGVTWGSNEFAPETRSQRRHGGRKNGKEMWRRVEGGTGKVER